MHIICAKMGYATTEYFGVAAMTTTVPGTGDVVYLTQALAKMSFYGVVTDASTPDQFSASMELQGDQGVVSLPVLVGQQGASGQPCFALRLQTDLSVNDAADLPKNLTNSEADLGKYFVIDDLDAEGHVIGSSAYIWFGQKAWRRIQIGSPGPPGPIPVITPTVEVFNKTKEPSRQSKIVVGGSNWEPAWKLELGVDEGPAGPTMSMIDAPDCDFRTREPEPGDVMGFTGKYNNQGDPMWVPVSVSSLMPSPYSVPQSSFQQFSGFSQQAPIGSFQLPAQVFPWTPIVWGHFTAFGLEATATPLTIGAEVRLGNPTSGKIIGRGFGNSRGEINIMPHYSTPTTPNAAISPTNGRAVVPAGHTDISQGTVYINLWNDGANGVYSFDPENAQLFILVVPIEQTV